MPEIYTVGDIVKIMEGKIRPEARTINDILNLVDDKNCNVTIDWTRYFDQIYCIHFLPDKARGTSVDRELNKIGVNRSPIFKYHYTYPDAYDKYALSKAPEKFRKVKTASLTLAYYRIALEAIWKDYQHILVIEDDVAFVAPLFFLKSMFDHLPEDYDYVHYDKLLSVSDAFRRDTLVPGKYYDSNYTGGYWGTVMSAFSKDALLLMADILTNLIVPADLILGNRDDERLITLKRYAAHNIVAIQQGREGEYQKGLT